MHPKPCHCDKVKRVASRPTILKRRSAHWRLVSASTLVDMYDLSRSTRRYTPAPLHSKDEFEAGAVATCMRPGTSMAAAAMANSVNANLLRRWVRAAAMKTMTCTAGNNLRAVKAPPFKSAFVPVNLRCPPQWP